MTLVDFAPPGTTAALIVLAVLGLIVFVIAPTVRYLNRRRTPIRADGALCRRLRQAGYLYHPTGPELDAAFATSKARLRLVEQMSRGERQ